MILEGVKLELRGNVLVIEKKGTAYSDALGGTSTKRHVEQVELNDGAALALRRAFNNMEARHG